MLARLARWHVGRNRLLGLCFVWPEGSRRDSSGRKKSGEAKARFGAPGTYSENYWLNGCDASRDSRAEMVWWRKSQAKFRARSGSEFAPARAFRT
jgi:hypothetical protein